MASPTSAQKATAPESREEFEGRMHDMVSFLQSTDTFFFNKHVSKSMATEMVQGPFAYCLEFPLDFMKQHGKKLGKDVTFRMRDSLRTWPIKLTERSFKRLKPRVFAYGAGGWKTFLTDNRIKVGDALIFILISFSQFDVIVGRAPVEDHPDDNDDDDDEGEYDMYLEGDDDKDDESSEKLYRNPSSWWNTDQAPVCCTECKQAPACPRFSVTIKSSSHLPHLSLVVPGRFGDLFGNALKCDDLQLKGPDKVIYVVKAKRTYDVDEEKLNVCLESGWEAFFVGNKLRDGDTLKFLLVGNSCFTVDLSRK